MDPDQALALVAHEPTEVGNAMGGYDCSCGKPITRYHDPRRLSMTSPIPIPPSTVADAKSRALRTFGQGLALDVAVAVSSVAATQLGDVHWTRAWWSLLGVLLAKTAMQSAVAYVQRRVGPPPA